MRRSFGEENPERIPLFKPPLSPDYHDVAGIQAYGLGRSPQNRNARVEMLSSWRNFAMALFEQEAGQRTARLIYSGHLTVWNETFGAFCEVWHESCFFVF